MRRVQRISTFRQAGFYASLLVSMGLVTIAAIGLGWVYKGMVTRDQWPIRWLEIDGEFDRVSAEQVRAGVSQFVGGSYFTVNLSDVREAAYRQPWVARVLVQKRWPDTVTVHVSEFEPVAHWTRGRLVSLEGEVFTVPGADEIQGLPWLDGTDVQQSEVFSSWQSFNRILIPTGLEIEQLKLDQRGAWYLELNNGTKVDVGRERAVERLTRMVESWSLLTKDVAVRPLGIDLRYTNGFAVRWAAEENNG